MTALARTAETGMPGTDTAPALVDPRPGALTAEIHDEFSAVEPLWRTFETQAVGTPYQRFDFARVYADTLATHEGFKTRIVVLKDASGRPRLLLPLAVRRTKGLRLASFIGGKHANFHMPLMAPDVACPTPDEVRSALVALGRSKLGIDAFSFTLQPVSWAGQPNPLAEDGLPSASDGHRLALDSDPEETLQRAFSRDARKKLRQKEKKLSEAGEVTHRVARTPEEVDGFVGAFCRQKETRFRELGIPNPFEEPGLPAFLTAAGLAGLDRGEPAIEWHALCVGERIVAVFGAAVDPDRACGMVISFDQSPQIARCSPGDLLLRAVIAFQCRAGRRTFDLGVGEARYKGLCDEVEALVDTFIPVTARGRAFALGSSWVVQGKRWVKQTPWAWRLASELRSRLTKLAS